MEENKENSSPSETSANLDSTKPCWYWDKEDLVHTPSQLDSLDPATESQYRLEGAKFIFDIGTRLGLHYDTLATGITYFHRFYMFHSFKQFPRYVTGACSLFLAGKVEETPKRCRDIIQVARSLLSDVQFGQFGDDPKEEIFALERILLQTIKFDLQVEHPYQFLLKYAKQLKGNKKKIEKLVQMAWTFVNDSLCTTLSLQWEPEIIAVSVMYLAGRLCKFEIQEWTSKPKYSRWWEQFVEDVPVDVLEDICHQILDIYSQENQQVPHQLQQPGSLQSTPPVPSVKQSQHFQSSEQLCLQQKVSQRTTEQQQQEAEPSKKPPPLPSPPRQVKQSVVFSPKENKAAKPLPSKIPQIETEHPSRLPVCLPPEQKPTFTAAISMGEGNGTSTTEARVLPQVHIPPQCHPAPIHQPPPLPHYSLPPPPSNYFNGMSNTNSYMSGEDYQSFQYMNPEGQVYGALPSVYGAPTHLPSYPYAYPLNPLTPVPYPPPTSFPSPPVPPETLGYFPQPTYTFNFQPPTHAIPPYPSPGLGMPPASYPPSAMPQGGQYPVPPPFFPPGTPSVRRMGHTDWMR
ncbi:cyclin-K-like [Dromiciops gliroides]|uniref:cyclin-K-like n=1 Tax=Dromiciops gliroides TaxID=33562 RepID=UPI001CC46F83|nr:cyclin-K-like [Dromiciops gliroides]